MSAPPHVLLVTGATGAVGGPLAAALARLPSVEHVYALVHADPLRVADPRVSAVRGDITCAGLGLDAVEARTLAARVTGVVHAAADTRFGAAPDAARLANVEGTRNVLAFAERCRGLDRVLALSTTHVAGRRTGSILEDELEHAAGFVNAYEASKYDAEREIEARKPSLPIAICRLSTIAGDSRTGEISRRAAIHHAVRLMYAGLAPIVPGPESSPVDLVARDYATDALAFLATRGFEAGAVWHLCAGGDAIAAGELLDLTIAAIAEYRPAWRSRTIERPAFADLATFDLFRRSVEQVGDAALRDSTAVMNRFAPQLAFPKWFADARCRAALAPAGLVRPPIRPMWRLVVKQLIHPGAGLDRTAPAPISGGMP